MSDETKFTPGPWIIDPQYPSEVQTYGDRTIASAWHECAAGRTITVTGVLECSLEESAANARLIAAAPDLFAACWAARAYVASHAHDSSGERLKQIEAAISKAVSA